ncbi:hypothetical protein M404DRAFT_145933, partial [Pisolithus tinctorius Marx 270]
NFSLKVIFMLTGWEGSVMDACVYGNATSANLHIPARKWVKHNRKYLLADAGYPSCQELLVPY